MRVSAVCSLPGQQALTAKRENNKPQLTQHSVTVSFQFKFSAVELEWSNRHTFVNMSRYLQEKKRTEKCSVNKILNIPQKEQIFF